MKIQSFRGVRDPKGKKVTFPTDILSVIEPFMKRDQEHFMVATLNGAHEIVSVRVVTIGLVDKTHVHPREVFKGAIVDNASAIICFHNHPSGCMEPSREDREVTEQLNEAGKIIGIKLLDHVIVGPTREKGYYSFMEEGVI